VENQGLVVAAGVIECGSTVIEVRDVEIDGQTGNDGNGGGGQDANIEGVFAQP
jgi:hypothetical protein